MKLYGLGRPQRSRSRRLRIATVARGLASMRLGNLSGWAALLVAALLAAGSARAQDFDDDDRDEHAEAPPEPARDKKKSPEPARPGEPKKFRDFDEVVRGARRIDGFFTLHRKDEHLYAEVRPHQFDEPFLAPVTIARGLGL